MLTAEFQAFLRNTEYTVKLLKETWKKHREKNKEKRNEYNRWYWHNVIKTKNKLSQEECLD